MTEFIDSTVGAVEVGILLASLLYGVLLMQVSLFVTSAKFRSGPSYLRKVVMAITMAETLHTIATWTYLYTLTVTDYGKSFSVLPDKWSLIGSIGLTSTIVCAVKCVFAHRIYVVSGKIWLALPGWILAFSALSLVIVIAVVSAESSFLAIIVGRHRWVITTALSISVVTDTYNTVTLCCLLRARRSHFRNTSMIIDQIILVSVETGLITNILSILVLSFELTLPHTSGVWIGALMLYAKLYGNCLLASLNVRNGQGESTKSSPPPSYELGTRSTQSAYRSYNPSRRETQQFDSMDTGREGPRSPKSRYDSRVIVISRLEEGAASASDQFA